MNRRRFISSLAIQLPALAALKPWLAQAAESAAGEKLPPIRQITRGSRFHWFGYYDKFQFSADNRFVLGNEVDFEGRSPRPEDQMRVGMVDLQAGTAAILPDSPTGLRSGVARLRRRFAAS